MRNVFLWIGVICAMLAQAQDKQLTIQEAIGGYHLYPSTVYYLQWVPETNQLSLLNRTEDGLFIEIRNSSDYELVRSIGLDELNAALSKAGLDSLKRLPRPEWISSTVFAFNSGEVFAQYDLNSNTCKKRFQMRKDASEVVYAANYSGYAGVVENGFAYEVGRYHGSLTTTQEGIVLGQSVHRNEFGIHNGLFFSPDGSRLAYYYMDESMVTQYPLYNLKGTPGTADMLRYPTAGKASHHVTLRIRTIGSNEKDVVLNVEGPEEQYLTNISWCPDNIHVLIAVVNREQNHMWLNKYNAVSGEFVATLFEEQHEKYIEPEHPAIFLPSDPTKFIWWSERDGYDHLYLYNEDGSLVKQLTKGEWVVTEYHGLSKDGKKLFISGTKESAIERHLYCVDMSNGKIKKLTSGAGTHRISPNSDNTAFIDNYSSVSVPREIRVIDEKGKEIKTIHSAPNPIEAYKKVDMEIGTIKNENGDELFYRVFLPSDFDPNKKYPAVVYLYNGPHAQLITNSWLGGANYWYHYMAQHGYVVYTIEGRGSDNRGRDFENAIFRNVGTVEMEDQLIGLNWLKSQSYVDSSRVGIHGWSYGGFMTISLMTRTPGNYKVGVAGGPVIDWALYEVMYTERYMDTPKENPEGYKQTDLKNYVGNLEGKLLVIHGGVDNVVLWEHSLEYVRATVENGVQIDYFVYPTHQHNVIGVDRIHLYDKISNYFFDNL